MTRRRDLDRLVGLLRIMVQLTRDLSERHGGHGDVLGRLAEDLDLLACRFDGVARDIEDGRQADGALH